MPRARYIVVSKPKTMKLVSVASPLSTQHKGERAKTGWLWIRIMFQSGATCLLIDCCFSELALYKSSYAYCYSTNRTSSTSHWKLTYSRPILINSFQYTIYTDHISSGTDIEGYNYWCLTPFSMIFQLYCERQYSTDYLNETSNFQIKLPPWRNVTSKVDHIML